MPFVELLKGPDRKRYYAIVGGETLGRGPENAIQLFAQGVSRVHLEFLHEDGAFVVIDKKSSNGTKVNGERIRRAVLKSGDEIKAGDVVLRFDDGECPDEPQPAPDADG